jgi:hypothetical protein
MSCGIRTGCGCSSGVSAAQRKSLDGDEIKTGEWSRADRVVAVVNDRPIVESEIMRRLEQMQRTQAIVLQKLPTEKSRCLTGSSTRRCFLKLPKKNPHCDDARVDNEMRKIMERLKMSQWTHSGKSRGGRTDSL